MAPEMFPTGYLRAHMFPLHPSTPGAWETLIAVNFPVQFEDTSSSIQIDFGAVLRKGPKVVHSFNRRVTLKPNATASLDQRRFTFLEPIDLEPGSYELTVVSADTGGMERPGALRINLEVPSITRRELMLVDPILGRPRDRNVVVRGDGPTKNRRSLSPELLALLDVVATRGSFEPLLIQRVDDVEMLYARNKACVVAGRKEVDEGTIERAVVEDQGPTVDLPSVPLELVASGKVRCQNVFETLPDDRIDPGRYELEATVENAPQAGTIHEALRFAVH